MVNLTAAERVYEYWIDKASSAADLVLKIVFAVILFLVARKLILWLCGLIRKNMRRFHTEEAVVSLRYRRLKSYSSTFSICCFSPRKRTHMPGRMSPRQRMMKISPRAAVPASPAMR